MKPTPGSDEAIRQGCTCPVLDNQYGQGYYGGPSGTFVYSGLCPLHREEYEQLLHQEPTR